MEAVTVPKPTFRVVYGHKDISIDVSPSILSLTYTDHLKGESDEMELQLEDAEQLWKGDWYPTKGDDLQFWLGFPGEPLLDCGMFQVDEMEASGPPDVLHVHALAVGSRHPVRTRQTRGFEDVTLRQVAQSVADRHGLQLQGDIGELRLQRLTQRNETDLAFLRRLADETGHVFSIRGDRLIFWEVEALESTPSALTVSRRDLKRFSLRDKTDATYKGVEVRYFDPGTKGMIMFGAKDQAAPREDVLKIMGRAEDVARARARSEAELHRAKVGQTAGTLTLPGDRRLVAGNILGLEDMGAFDGDYQITTSRHTISRDGGYGTEVGVHRTASGVQYKAKKKAGQMKHKGNAAGVR